LLDGRIVDRGRLLGRRQQAIRGAAAEQPHDFAVRQRRGDGLLQREIPHLVIFQIADRGGRTGHSDLGQRGAFNIGILDVVGHALVVRQVAVLEEVECAAGSAARKQRQQRQHNRPELATLSAHRSVFL
jgi:hypothetical protein